MRDIRHVRFETLLPVEKFSSIKVGVAGVGAVGRQVALQLATMGISDVRVADFDFVDDENLGSQGYRPDQVGCPKALATVNDMLAINPDAEFSASEAPWRGRREDVLFLCVDHMDARRHIMEEAEDQNMKLVIDSRMGALTTTIHTVPMHKVDVVEKWYDNWYPQTDAVQEPCTARTTFYCASVTAGLMVSQFMMWLADRDAPSNVLTLNLPALELTVGEVRPFINS